MRVSTYRLEAMDISVARTLSMLAFVAGAWAPLALAEAAPAAPDKPVAAAAQTPAGFDVLVGRWVRPDGGYLITVKGVDAHGKLDAAYANPNPLPFSKAEASRDGSRLKVFLELRAGGYSGSTYTLEYDPAQDVLKGVYYQAVAQQKFAVYFNRVK
jgi:uncharacterized protein (DUF2147 family)